MAKENKPASAYAEPHTMSGQKTDVTTYMNYTSGSERMNKMNIAVGGINKGSYPPENPYGTGKMRGGGAATKGLKISGKMG